MNEIAAALGIDLEDPDERAFLAVHRQRRELIDKLVEIRKQRDKTRDDVAEELGISRVAVARFENEDRDVKISTLMRYAEAIGAVLTLDARPIEAVTDRPWPSASRTSWKTPQPAALRGKAAPGEKSADFVLAA